MTTSLPPGILAADESTGTMGKRLANCGLDNTEDNRLEELEDPGLIPPFQEGLQTTALHLGQGEIQPEDQWGKDDIDYIFNLYSGHLVP